MKKIVSLLILVVAFTFTAQAQKKGGKQSVEKVLKRLTTALDLTDDQQQKIKPLLISQIEDRKLMMDQMKAMQKSFIRQNPEFFEETSISAREERLASSSIDSV